MTRNAFRTQPVPYNPGNGAQHAIATRLLHPQENRPKNRPGAWFVWRHRSVFVHESDLASAVTGSVYGVDLDLMRVSVQSAIAAHHGQPYDMTVAVSQKKVVVEIERQLRAAAVWTAQMVSPTAVAATPPAAPSTPPTP